MSETQPSSYASDYERCNEKQDLTIAKDMESCCSLRANVVGAHVRSEASMWKKSEYVEYRLKVTQDGRTWEIGRRFSQFRALHRALAAIGKFWLPKPPLRKTGIFDKTARWVRIKRQFELQVYLYELMTRSPDVCQFGVFQDFLLEDTSSPDIKPRRF